MYRNAKYLEFTRNRYPVLCGEGPTEAHHVRLLGGGGTGIKPSDTLCLPVSMSMHLKIHSPGNSEKSTFDEAGYSAPDVKALVRENICAYLESLNIDSERLIIDLLTKHMEENRL